MEHGRTHVSTTSYGTVAYMPVHSAGAEVDRMDAWLQASCRAVPWLWLLRRDQLLLCS